MKSAKEILQEIANNPEINPDERITACIQILNQDRQEKYDAMDHSLDVPYPGNDFQEKLESLEKDVEELKSILHSFLEEH